MALTMQIYMAKGKFAILVKFRGIFANFPLIFDTLLHLSASSYFALDEGLPRGGSAKIS
jgi:hypothetical protein